MANPMPRICLGFLIVYCAVSPVMAKSSHYGYRSFYRHAALGRTHNVKTHYRRNHGVIFGHRAGNPRSNIHCQNNICY